MKYISVVDAYALALIVQNPTCDWTNITEHLSEHAKKIAEEIISPRHAADEIQTAANELMMATKKTHTRN